MIKCINNDIKIGHASELSFYINFDPYIGRFKLPLLSIKPRFITKEELENENDPICFIMSYELYAKGLSLSLIDSINNAWNEFYD